MSEVASSLAAPAAPATAAVAPRSPFHGHVPFERRARAGGVGVRLQAGTLRSVTQIHTWPAGIDALGSALSQTLGAAVPVRTQTLVSVPHGVLMRTGPEEFLLVSDSATPLWPTLRQAIAADIGSVTDLSHARCRIRIGGTDSRAMLSKLFALDLREPAFPVGELRLTGHHHVPCLLLRQGVDDFEMLVFSTYAHDQLGTLVDAALEYGVALEEAAPA